MTNFSLLATSVIVSTLVASAAWAQTPATSSSTSKPATTQATAGPTGDLPLKDGDRIVFIGDSIQTQYLWTCYLSSYFILMNPSLTLHTQVIARGGSSVAGWLDSGDDSSEYSKTTYALQPNYVFTFTSNNGGLDVKRHKAAEETLVKDYIIGRSHATPIILGMIPMVNSTGFYLAGEFDKANEEIALAATPPIRYVKTWMALAPAFTQNKIFTADAATDTCTCPGHGYKDGQKVMLECSGNPPGPGGLDNGTIYYVRDVTADTFKLALTPGGPAVDITSDGKDKQRVSAAWPLMRTKLNDADHPGVPGQIAYAKVLITALGFTTHVSSATIDAAGKKVTASDQCTIEAVAANANGGIDFTRLDKRLPWAIDERGREDAYFIFPDLKGWLDYSQTVTGLPAGTYDVLINGKKVAELTDAQLAAGWNMADLTAGPVWEQVQEVLGRIRDMQWVEREMKLQGDRWGFKERGTPRQGVGLYKSGVTWMYRAPNSKRGQDLINSVKEAVASIDAMDKLIHDAAQPQKLTFSIRLQKAGSAQ